jgi:gamma-glutamylcysteine synthetase
MIDEEEVLGQENTTIDSIDFNQIGTFKERDSVRTSILGNTLKDHLLKTKFLISLARSVLRVSKQGARLRAYPGRYPAD